MLKEIKLTEIVCKRCGHTWIARTKDIKRCPKCKSCYWDRKKILKGVLKYGL
jgi:predicted Zn-ribbon and HTH transcriptional regulator